MNVSIVGMGYVGLVSGVCLAQKGHRVTCVDIDQDRVNLVRQGKAPIYEIGLDKMLADNVGKRLFATNDLARAVGQSDVTLIAVGTPFDGFAIDLTYVKTVAAQVGSALRGKSGRHEVIVKSTVVPGTTDEVVGPILEETSGHTIGDSIGLGMNPEFLTEGTAIHDFMNPDRIVLGGQDEQTIETLARLYKGFEGAEIVRTNNRTAELIKYASNALLATMISFSNEIANLASRIGGIDAIDVMRGVHLSNYLSPVQTDGSRTPAPITSFLMPGCGFGGSCLPKDVSALVAQGNSIGSPMPLLEAVLAVNAAQVAQVMALLARHFDDLRGRRISVLGLAFKPDTDDIRQSPAGPLIQALRKAGAKIAAYDPLVNGAAAESFSEGDVDFPDTLEQAIESAHAVILVTRWKDFEIVPELLGRLSSPPLLVDGRRMIDKTLVPHYEGIGLSW